MTIFSIIFFVPSPHFPHSRSFHTQINIFVKSYYAKMRIAAKSVSGVDSRAGMRYTMPSIAVFEFCGMK